MKIISPVKVKEGSFSESIVMAQIKKVQLEPSEKTPKFCVLHFSLPEGGLELPKKYPLSFEPDSLLRKDLEVIMGRPLTGEEVESGYDTTDLEGKKVPTVLMFRLGAGGKPFPAIGPVFSVKKLKQTITTLE